jgi:allantoin racemase
MFCLDEPGVAAAREALTIPVTSDAQAAMHYASCLGRRFSFVLGGPGPESGKWAEGLGTLEDLAKKYGFASKLASIRTFPASPLDFAAQKEGLAESMLRQAKKAVEEDSADVIIGYGGIDIIRHLQEQLDVPVISPIQASVMLAIALARLNLAQSKRAYPKPSTV